PHLAPRVEHPSAGEVDLLESPLQLVLVGVLHLEGLEGDARPEAPRALLTEEVQVPGYWLDEQVAEVPPRAAGPADAAEAPGCRVLGRRLYRAREGRCHEPGQRRREERTSGTTRSARVQGHDILHVDQRRRASELVSRRVGRNATGKGRSRRGRDRTAGLIAEPRTGKRRAPGSA